MNILVLNAILCTAEKGVIPHVKTIKDTMIYNMCLGFRRLGHSVTLVAAADYRPEKDESYDFEVLFLESRYKKLLKPDLLPYLPGLSGYLKREGRRFDMVVSSEAFSLLTLDAARVCPEKLLVWQEMNVHQQKFHRIPSLVWHYGFVRLFCRNVCAVAARSESARQFIRPFFKRVSEQVVEHGIDIEKFLPASGKKRTLISTAQLVPRKRIDEMIRTFAALHGTAGYEDVRLLIAGRGTSEDELKRLAHGLGLDGCVDFLGFLPQRELNAHIRESMCSLVNTSRDLNMVSVPESIVSGTPVLTNTVPASAGYIRRNGLGVVKDGWGVDELKTVIDGNTRYVENCIAYRPRLSSEAAAQSLIDIFLSFSGK